MQSVTKSIHSQPHESMGISLYEMMFGVPMHLPMELEHGNIPHSASKDQLANVMPNPPQGKDAIKIFESVNTIQQIMIKSQNCIIFDGSSFKALLSKAAARAHLSL